LRRRAWPWPLAVALGCAVLVACSNSSSSASTSTRASTTTTTAAPASTPSTTSVNAVATKCASAAPVGYSKFFTSENVTVAEIRAIVVGTLPPPPTSVLLDGHQGSEQAVMCWATDGAGRYVQYWVTQDGHTKPLCINSAPETLQPDQVGTIRCF